MVSELPVDMVLCILQFVTHPVDRAALRCISGLRNLVDPVKEQHLLNLLGASSRDYGVRLLSARGPIMEFVKTTRYTSVFRRHRFTVRKIRTDFTFCGKTSKVFEGVDAARVIDLCESDSRRVMVTEFFRVSSGKPINSTQKWQFKLY